jgi:hypothetical protein
MTSYRALGYAIAVLALAVAGVWALLIASITNCRHVPLIRALAQRTTGSPHGQRFSAWARWSLSSRCWRPGVVHHDRTEDPSDVASGRKRHPRTRAKARPTFGELMIDREQDRVLRAVLVGDAARDLTAVDDSDKRTLETLPRTIVRGHCARLPVSRTVRRAWDMRRTASTDVLCEHRSTSDPVLFRAILKVRDGAGGATGGWNVAPANAAGRFRTNVESVE